MASSEEKKKPLTHAALREKLLKEEEVGLIIQRTNGIGVYYLDSRVWLTFIARLNNLLEVFPIYTIRKDLCHFILVHKHNLNNNFFHVWNDNLN